MSSFCVILAEQISINLRYMDYESQSLLTSRVFTWLFKLFKLKLAYHNQIIHANYDLNHAPRK